MATLGIPWLLRDLTRHAARFGGMVVRLAIVEAVPTTYVNKRELNEKPEKQKANESAEWKSSARGLSPYEEI